MKTKIFFPSLIICSVCAVSYSQTLKESIATAERRDSVGLQHNALSDNAKDNVANIFSLDYGHHNVKSLMIGNEISGFFLYREYPMDEIYGVSLAFYPRHFNSAYKTNGLGEPSQLNQVYFNNKLEFKNSDGFIIIAPGISLYSKNRKFSLDIYHRLSTPIIIDGIQPIMPYKVNFHF
jgi:hypothetical protein